MKINKLKQIDRIEYYLKYLKIENDLTNLLLIPSLILVASIFLMISLISLALFFNINLIGYHDRITFIVSFASSVTLLFIVFAIANYHISRKKLRREYVKEVLIK